MRRRRIVARIRSHDGMHAWVIIMTPRGVFIRHKQHNGLRMVIISQKPISLANLNGKTPSSQYAHDNVLSSD